MVMADDKLIDVSFSGKDDGMFCTILKGGMFDSSTHSSDATCVEKWIQLIERAWFLHSLVFVCGVLSPLVCPRTFDSFRRCISSGQAAL